MPTTRRFAPALGLAACLLFLLPGASLAAGTVSLSGTTITYTGDAGNEYVDVTVAGGDVLFDEMDEDLTAGANCLPIADAGSADVECPLGDVTSIVVNLAGGLDTLAASTMTIAITVDGGDGSDSVTTGSGADTLTGGGSADSLSGNGGADTYQGGRGDDLLVNGGSTEADVFQGGEGRDIVSYSNYGVLEPVVAAIDNIANDGLAGEADNVKDDIEELDGGDGNDTLTGNSGDNRLGGGNGNDTLEGGLGTDQYDGSFDNDTILAREATSAVADIIDCSSGNDTATVDHLDVIMLTGVCEVVNRSAAPAPSVAPAGLVDGSSASETLTGADIAEVFRAGDGNDIVRAGDGDDTLLGQLGNDKLFGEDGNDDIFGGAGNDALNGGNGADLLVGGSGSDQFDAGSSKDTLLTADGRKEKKINCGAGRDIVVADRSDVVNRNCERVIRR